MGLHSAETCPWCGTSLIADDDEPDDRGTMRYECPKCTGGVFFKENGILVDSMHRGNSQNRLCENCQQSLSGGRSALPWEDGNNSHAYTKCPHCGYKNVRYGFGEDD